MCPLYVYTIIYQVNEAKTIPDSMDRVKNGYELGRNGIDSEVHTLSVMDLENDVIML